MLGLFGDHESFHESHGGSYIPDDSGNQLAPPPSLPASSSAPPAQSAARAAANSSLGPRRATKETYYSGTYNPASEYSVSALLGDDALARHRGGSMRGSSDDTDGHTSAVAAGVAPPASALDRARALSREMQAQRTENSKLARDRKLSRDRVLSVDGAEHYKPVQMSISGMLDAEYSQGYVVGPDDAPERLEAAAAAVASSRRAAPAHVPAHQQKAGHLTREQLASVAAAETYVPAIQPAQSLSSMLDPEYASGYTIHDREEEEVTPETKPADPPAASLARMRLTQAQHERDEAAKGKRRDSRDLMSFVKSGNVRPEPMNLSRMVADDAVSAHHGPHVGGASAHGRKAEGDGQSGVPPAAGAHRGTSAEDIKARARAQARQIAAELQVEPVDAKGKYYKSDVHVPVANRPLHHSLHQ